jgi:hypothetical protein
MALKKGEFVNDKLSYLILQVGLQFEITTGDNDKAKGT